MTGVMPSIDEEYPYYKMLNIRLRKLGGRQRP